MSGEKIRILEERDFLPHDTDSCPTEGVQFL
jgi:hypothetical protein